MIPCFADTSAVLIGLGNKIFILCCFSKPFTHTLYTDTIEEGGQQIPVCKMLLRFDTAEDEQVMVRFSISSVDGEGARQNLLAELPDWDFDKVRADARKTWNDCLSKIEVKTEDPDQLAISILPCIMHS